MAKIGRGSQLNPTSITSWEGGLNTETGLYTDSTKTVKDACDIEFENDGSICTRKENLPFTTAGANGGLKGWLQWEDGSGAPYLIWMRNDGSLAFVGNGPAVQSVNVFQFTTTATCELTSFEAHGKLYISNGVQVLQWDSSPLPTFPGILTDVTNATVHEAIITPANASLTTNLGVPAFCEGLSWSGRAWVVNPKVTIPPIATPIQNHNDEVWYSRPFDTYPTLGLTGERDYSNARALTFTTNSDIDQIVALQAAGKKLYVLKQRSIHYIQESEFNLSQFKAVLATADLGVANKKAKASLDNNLFFYDEYRGLHAIDESGQIIYMMGTIDSVKKKNKNPGITAVGIVGSNVYLSVAINNSLRNDTTFIYNTLNKTWTKSCRGYVDFMSYRPTGNDGISFGTPTNDKTEYLAYAVDPCESIVRLEAGDQTTVTDQYGCGNFDYKPYVEFNFSDFGSSQIEKAGVCFTFSFESLDGNVRIQSFDDWSTACSALDKTYPIKGSPPECVRPLAGFTEIISPTKTIVHPAAPALTANVKSITEVSHADRCRFLSKAFRVTTVNGPWCLRKISSLHKVGRFRF
jgi:hypothetical protein